jgi:hypothetical protein
MLQDKRKLPLIQFTLSKLYCMKHSPLFYSLICVAALLFSACCGDCNRTFVGTFLISDDAREQLDFASDDTRLFSSNGNQTEVLSYSIPFFSRDQVPFNCIELGNCGTCCDEYEAESAYLELSSAGNAFVFDISLQKDFLNNLPTDPPNTVGDFFSITMNNQLTGELFLDNPLYKDRVTVNGQEYRNVFEVLADPSSLDSTKRDPAAFYFYPDQGIVAFRLANGEEWSL